MSTGTGEPKSRSKPRSQLINTRQNKVKREVPGLAASGESSPGALGRGWAAPLRLHTCQTQTHICCPALLSSLQAARSSPPNSVCPKMPNEASAGSSFPAWISSTPRLAQVQVPGNPQCPPCSSGPRQAGYQALALGQPHNPASEKPQVSPRPESSLHTPSVLPTP